MAMTGYTVRVQRDQLDQALTQAKVVHGVALAELVRRLIWQLAQTTPALPGMPAAGLFPEGRSIASAVHGSHDLLDEDLLRLSWSECPHPGCTELRHQLGLS